MLDQEIKGSSLCELQNLVERNQSPEQLEDEGYSDQEQVKTFVNLNKLCLLDSKTLREALDSAESVQQESDMQEQITEEEEELYIQDSPEEKAAQNDFKFKLDLNFGFKDDLLAESDGDLNQKLKSSCFEIPFPGDYHSTASQRNADLNEFCQAELEAQAVLPKVAGQLQIVKRKAEKIRKESFISSVSSDPNLKDVKPKVQSFNTNYLKPKFLKQKSRDVSQSSVQTKSRPGSTLDQADSVTKQVKEERPPQRLPLSAKSNITIEVAQRNPSKAGDSLLKQQIRPISSSYSSIKNLRTKYSTVTEDPVTVRIVQPPLKEHESLGVIKMKFKAEKCPSISKYKQKRQSVVEINRLQLKLNQPVAKPLIGFESPHHFVKQKSPQPSKQPATKNLRESKQDESLIQVTSQQKVKREEAATEISNIQKDEEHNYESGEERSLLGLNEKNQVTKGMQTDLEMATNCTVDSLINSTFVNGKSLAKVASFGNKENRECMEQTFKPEAKAANNQKVNTGQTNDFFKSNTYLKMTSQNSQQSSFNTLSVDTGKDSVFRLQAVSQAFSSIKVEQLQNRQLHQRSINTNSKLRLSTSKLQASSSNVFSHRSAVSQKNSCVPIAPKNFESEQLEYLKVIEDLRSLIAKPQPHTPKQKELKVVQRDFQNQTTAPSDSRSAKQANNNKPVSSEEAKKRMMFDLRLKNEIKEIRLHLQDSSRSSKKLNGHAAWLAMKLDAQKRKNDIAEREIRKVQEIKKLLV